MKRTDIAMIVLIAAVSAGLAYFIANSLFGGISPQQGVKVKTIDPITSVVQKPDTNIFNDQSINPSIQVNVPSTDTGTTTATTP